jgi:hypothetical protein
MPSDCLIIARATCYHKHRNTIHKVIETIGEGSSEIAIGFLSDRFVLMTVDAMDLSTCVFNFKLSDLQHYETRCPIVFRCSVQPLLNFIQKQCEITSITFECVDWNLYIRYTPTNVVKLPFSFYSTKYYDIDNRLYENMSHFKISPETFQYILTSILIGSTKVRISICGKQTLIRSTLETGYVEIKLEVEDIQNAPGAVVDQVDIFAKYLRILCTIIPQTQALTIFIANNKPVFFECKLRPVGTFVFVVAPTL